MIFFSDRKTTKMKWKWISTRMFTLVFHFDRTEEDHETKCHQRTWIKAGLVAKTYREKLNIALARCISCICSGVGFNFCTKLKQMPGCPQISCRDTASMSCSEMFPMTVCSLNSQSRHCIARSSARFRFDRKARSCLESREEDPWTAQSACTVVRSVTHLSGTTA